MPNHVTGCPALQGVLDEHFGIQRLLRLAQGGREAAPFEFGRNRHVAKLRQRGKKLHQADRRLAEHVCGRHSGHTNNQRHARGSFVENELLPQPVLTQHLSVIGSVENHGVFFQIQFL